LRTALGASLVLSMLSLAPAIVAVKGPPVVLKASDLGSGEVAFLAVQNG
jgi:hypothetical protein